MLALLRHFGDLDDANEPCGMCDACAPESCVARRFREPSDEEQAWIARLVDALKREDGQATGKLYRERFEKEGVDRKTFEHILGGLVRAGYVELSVEHFEKEGRRVEYNRARLTRAGHQATGGGPSVSLAREAPGKKGAPKTKRREGGRRSKPERPDATTAIDVRVDPRLVDRLKMWRLDEARRRRVPAFNILNDKTLALLAAQRPEDIDALRAVRGIGPKIADTYGAHLVRLLHEADFGA
jgi:DNA topoisomerase-3